MNQKIIFIIAFVLLLSACAPTLVETSLAPETPSPTVAPTSTFTPRPTETPAPTSTPDISNLTIEEISDLYINSEIDYPSELPDDKLHEFSVLNARYVNEGAPTEATGYLNKDGVTYEVGLTVSGKWKRKDVTPPEEFVGALENIPPVFGAAYENSNGDVVIISETGEEIILPRFTLPGKLNGLSLAEVTAIEPAELKTYALGLVETGVIIKNPTADAATISDFLKDEFDSAFIPGFIDPFYENNDLAVLWADPTFTADRTVYTSFFGKLIVDKDNNVIGYVRVNQSPAGTVSTFDVTDENNVDFESSTVFSSDVFGKMPGDYLALIDLQNGTANNFLQQGGEGLGGAAVAQSINEIDSLTEAKQITENYRIIFAMVEHAVLDR